VIAMKKKVKIIGGILLSVIVTAAITVQALAPLSLEATTLQSTTARVTFTEQGILQYNDILNVYPILSGELLELRVREGDRVAKGDILAIVSAKDAEYEILQLESSIKGYNAQIYNLTLQEKQEKDALTGTKNNLIGQLAALESQIQGRAGVEESREYQISLQEDIVMRDRANARIARNNLRDFKDEFGYDDYDDEYSYDIEHNALREARNTAEKILSASELQLAQLQNSAIPEGYYEGQKESLQAQIDSIDTRLGKSYTGAMQTYYASMIESAESGIRQLTERKGQATILSPMNGVVSEVPVKESNTVSQSACIATIGSDPMVEVFVPIREIDGVKTGDAVELIIDKRLGNEVLAGTVTLVEEKAQVRLSALGVDERKVRVLVKPKSTGLRVGFNMDVKFTVFEQPDCVVVPKTAVFEKDGQNMVWVIEGGVARRRVIEKGVETREGYAIASGLSAGEAVVTDANNEAIAEGKRITMEK